MIAETTLTDEAIRRVLRTTAEDLVALAWVGTHGAVASGMQSVAFTPASAIAAIFAATGQDLGMVGTSSMAHGTGGGSREACTFGALPRPRGRHRRRRHDAADSRSGSRVMGCAGAGTVYRFAQIVAAAALALEISASAAMATAG